MSALHTNFKYCLYGGWIINEFFECSVPTLEKYLAVGFIEKTDIAMGPYKAN